MLVFVTDHKCIDIRHFAAGLWRVIPVNAEFSRGHAQTREIPAYAEMTASRVILMNPVTVTYFLSLFFFTSSRNFFEYLPFDVSASLFQYL